MATRAPPPPPALLEIPPPLLAKAPPPHSLLFSPLRASPAHREWSPHRSNHRRISRKLFRPSIQTAANPKPRTPVARCHRHPHEAQTVGSYSGVVCPNA